MQSIFLQEDDRITELYCIIVQNLGCAARYPLLFVIIFIIFVCMYLSVDFFDFVLTNITCTVSRLSIFGHIIKSIETNANELTRELLDISRSFVVPTVKDQIARILDCITLGSITIETDEGTVTYGDLYDHGPHVSLTVLSEQFWIRLMMTKDLGFAEAYMAGEIVISNLVDFIRLYIYNREALDAISSSPFVGSLIYLANTRFGNSLLNTATNISAHYDLGNEMFEMFLDATMTYSCAVWDGPNDTLEAAQVRKLDMLIDKAQLRSTDRVLDLGCGWGSLAIRAVERTGCQVVGVTLSEEQKEVAEQRIAAAGLSDRIHIVLCDYRKLDPAEYRFDKIISLEMVEHVGYEYLETYFAQCDRLLDPHHGIMVLQASTMNEERYGAYRHTVDFINKHIFPGGHCPSVSALVTGATKGSAGRLMLESAANFPDHYARTLRVWRERFMSGYDKTLASALPKNPQLILQERSLSMGEGAGKLDVNEVSSSCEDSGDEEEVTYNSVFRRKWEYYFAYCEGAFATRTLGCTQLVFTRTYNEELSNIVNLTY